jgi:hypothetical protein
MGICCSLLPQNSRSLDCARDDIFFIKLTVSTELTGADTVCPGTCRLAQRREFESTER